MSWSSNIFYTVVLPSMDSSLNPLYYWLLPQKGGDFLTLSSLLHFATAFYYKEVLSLLFNSTTLSSYITFYSTFYSLLLSFFLFMLALSSTWPVEAPEHQLLYLSHTSQQILGMSLRSYTIRCSFLHSP